MSDETLFPLDEIPLVPLVREPRARKGAAAGSRLDGRFKNEYPPDWDRCQTCKGRGKTFRGFPEIGEHGMMPEMPTCPDCKGMGSVKARVRLEAGHRCVRCKHPFMTKGDAKMLGVDPSPGMWSPCDEQCEHAGPIRYRMPPAEEWTNEDQFYREPGVWQRDGHAVEGFWRVLTTHHLDGDKANLAWWNLAALCQRCHLEIQAKVVMERVYPHEHSEWFRPYAAGFYAFVYLCKTCGSRLDNRPPASRPQGSYLDIDSLNVLAGVDGYPHTCEPGLLLPRVLVEEHLERLLDLERAQ